MKSISVPLPLAASAVLIAGTIVWIATKPADVFAQGRSSYAEDRAAIEDLQARYLFALDFHDPDLYVSITKAVMSGPIRAARIRRGKFGQDSHETP
jgi:hypothetical protein